MTYHNRSYILVSNGSGVKNFYLHTLWAQRLDVLVPTLFHNDCITSMTICTALLYNDKSAFISIANFNSMYKSFKIFNLPEVVKRSTVRIWGYEMAKKFLQQFNLLGM